MSISAHIPVPIEENAARIIMAVLDRPMTALQIARASGMPVAEAFRLTRVLAADGLLRMEGQVFEGRDRLAPLYSSTCRECIVFAEGGRLRARLLLNADAPEAFDGRVL